MPSITLKPQLIEPFLRELSGLLESGYEEPQIEETLELIAAMDPNDSVGDGYDCTVMLNGTASELEIAVFNAPGGSKEIHIHGVPALSDKLWEMVENYGH